jgi:hypothetical protein
MAVTPTDGTGGRALTGSGKSEWPSNEPGRLLLRFAVSEEILEDLFGVVERVAAYSDTAELYAFLRVEGPPFNGAFAEAMSNSLSTLRLAPSKEKRSVSPL